MTALISLPKKHRRRATPAAKKEIRKVLSPAHTWVLLFWFLSVVLPPSSENRVGDFFNHTQKNVCEKSTQDVELQRENPEVVSLWASGRARFLSPDPLGHGSDMSLYSYCQDPINCVDADGRLATQAKNGAVNLWNTGTFMAASKISQDYTNLSHAAIFAGSSFVTNAGLVPRIIAGGSFENPNAYGMGYDWLSGISSNDRTFGNGSNLVNQFSQSSDMSWVRQQAYAQAVDQYEVIGSMRPIEVNFSKNLGQVPEGSYLRQFSNDVGGLGLSNGSNPTRGLLGSYSAQAVAIPSIDPTTGSLNLSVNYTVNNQMTWESALRKSPSAGGYDFQNPNQSRTWIPASNNMFGENGMGGDVSLTLKWNENSTFYTK